MKNIFSSKFKIVTKAFYHLSSFLESHCIKHNNILKGDCPDELQLKFWASSEWIEYQAWIFQKGFLTYKMWQDLRKKSFELLDPPLISILTPTFNTDPDMLRECIYSIQTQVYHNWEMCIVDDGSSNQATIDLLNQYAGEDHRINVFLSPENQGICDATNQALSMAKGQYVAFLDHDDRLAPDALFCVARAICGNPEIDIVYSDRDMLSLRGLRFMHLFKPDWSPELLFSMNYICHLMVYRKSMVDAVGGIHHEFEGSQDYDLILRVMELDPVVHHIDKVLYHWRQNEQSVALNHNAKTYAYKAGVLALEHTLKRRGLRGSVSELSDLWRGHYRVRLDPPSYEKTAVISGHEGISAGSYTSYLKNEVEKIDKQEFIVFIGGVLFVHDKNVVAAIQEMVSWFQIKEVGIVTGKIIDTESKIMHAGMVLKQDGIPLFIFEGYDESEPGYMASTLVVRNVSAPYPGCFAIRKSLWEELEGVDLKYKGPHSMLDLSLRAMEKGYRTIYTPFSKFVFKENVYSVLSWPEKDRLCFIQKWGSWLKKGDPYYNRHLTLNLVDMGLNADVGDLTMENYKNVKLEFNIQSA